VHLLPELEHGELQLATRLSRHRLSNENGHSEHVKTNPGESSSRSYLIGRGTAAVWHLRYGWLKCVYLSMSEAGPVVQLVAQSDVVT
jgi:hypothetical protein